MFLQECVRANVFNIQRKDKYLEGFVYKRKGEWLDPSSKRVE